MQLIDTNYLLYFKRRKISDEIFHFIMNNSIKLILIFKPITHATPHTGYTQNHNEFYSGNLAKFIIDTKFD